MSVATRYRKYVAAIIFIRLKKEPLFLILRRKQNWKGWEYVKGGLLPGESLKVALAREILEETGQKKFKIHLKLPFKIKYKWPKTYLKDKKRYCGAVQQVYVVEIFSKKIKLDRKEHSGYKWVTGKIALKLLTYKEPKAALRYVLKGTSIVQKD
ncbi:MAG: NUDIX domain-containing protein [Candidatus Nanoarchaeia archaeon]